MIVGITRVRNEGLIIEDTLRHALEYVNQIILYDDCSTDDTVDIARSFSRVHVIQGVRWVKQRTLEETRHRALLLDMAREFGATWAWCFDADERLVGSFPDLKADAYKFRLFDGYLTPETNKPYTGGPLIDLHRLWGPEYRDITMLFKVDKAEYKGLDRREPIIHGTTELCGVRVKHFGKCLSVDHWEDTCEYYSKHWPKKYTEKWNARRGKAIHDKSDFGNPLYNWEELDYYKVKM